MPGNQWNINNGHHPVPTFKEPGKIIAVEIIYEMTPLS